jgi:hypothetical protein
MVYSSVFLRGDLTSNLDRLGPGCQQAFSHALPFVIASNLREAFLHPVKNTDRRAQAVASGKGRRAANPLAFLIPWRGGTPLALILKTGFLLNRFSFRVVQEGFLRGKRHKGWTTFFSYSALLWRFFLHS